MYKIYLLSIECTLSQNLNNCNKILVKGVIYNPAVPPVKIVSVVTDSDCVNVLS